jgi:hypothetical protein
MREGALSSMGLTFPPALKLTNDSNGRVPVLGRARKAETACKARNPGGAGIRASTSSGSTRGQRRPGVEGRWGGSRLGVAK